MTHFYGIDIGSSSIKGAVLDLAAGRVEHIVSRPFPDPLPVKTPLSFAVDTATIVSNVRDLLDALTASEPNARGIMFSSQMGGLVLADERGIAVMPYLSWRDQRVMAVDRANERTWFERFLSLVSSEDLAAIGGELRPGSAVTLLAWLCERGELPAGRSMAMHLGDYVVSQLTGAAPRTERTLALGTLDLAAGRINRDWLGRLGLGEIAWPELTDATTSVGAIRCGERSVPCYAAVGDQQAALFGAGLAEGELSVNVSTGAQVSTLTRKLELGDYQTRPYFGGSFLNTLTHLPGGRGLNVLVDLLGELATREQIELRDPWGSIARAVEASSSAELEVDLSFFAGAGASGGFIRGMHSDNVTLGALFHGAFRHMAEVYERAAKRVSAGAECRGVVISGGLPQRMLALRRMIANRLRLPDRMTTATEETLAGLLQLARQVESDTNATAS